MQSSFDYRFTVLLNHADQFWLNVKNNCATYATKEEMEKLRLEVCCKIDAKEEDERVLLTCLNHDNVNKKQIDQMNQTEIYTVRKLRRKVFEKMQEQIPKSSDKDDIRRILNEKMVEDCLIKEKSIIVKKFGKNSKIELHLIDHKENCVTDDSDHTDIKSFKRLIEEIKIQFDLNEPVIRPEHGSKIIESFKEILEIEAHNFCAYEKA